METKKRGPEALLLRALTRAGVPRKAQATFLARVRRAGVARERALRLLQQAAPVVEVAMKAAGLDAALWGNVLQAADRVARLDLDAMGMGEQS